jgi:hypothetical protein
MKSYLQTRLLKKDLHPLLPCRCAPFQNCCNGKLQFVSPAEQQPHDDGTLFERLFFGRQLAGVRSRWYAGRQAKIGRNTWATRRMQKAFPDPVIVSNRSTLNRTAPYF